MNLSGFITQQWNVTLTSVPIHYSYKCRGSELVRTPISGIEKSFKNKKNYERKHKPIHN